MGLRSFPLAVVSLGAFLLTSLTGCGGSHTKQVSTTRSAIVGTAVRASDQIPLAQTEVYARHALCDATGNDCNFTEGAGDAPRVTADGRGHFVMALAPGRYYVGFNAPSGPCTSYQDGKWADVYANQETDVSVQMTEGPTCIVE